MDASSGLERQLTQAIKEVEAELEDMRQRFPALVAAQDLRFLVAGKTVQRQIFLLTAAQDRLNNNNDENTFNIVNDILTGHAELWNRAAFKVIKEKVLKQDSDNLLDDGNRDISLQLAQLTTLVQEIDQALGKLSSYRSDVDLNAFVNGINELCKALPVLPKALPNMITDEWLTEIRRLHGELSRLKSNTTDSPQDPKKIAWSEVASTVQKSLIDLRLTFLATMDPAKFSANPVLQLERQLQEFQATGYETLALGNNTVWQRYESPLRDLEPDPAILLNLVEVIANKPDKAGQLEALLTERLQEIFMYFSGPTLDSLQKEITDRLQNECGFDKARVNLALHDAQEKADDEVIESTLSQLEDLVRSRYEKLPTEKTRIKGSQEEKYFEFDKKKDDSQSEYEKKATPLFNELIRRWGNLPEIISLESRYKQSQPIYNASRSIGTGRRERMVPTLPTNKAELEETIKQITGQGQQTDMVSELSKALRKTKAGKTPVRQSNKDEITQPTSGHEVHFDREAQAWDASSTSSKSPSAAPERVPLFPAQASVRGNFTAKKRTYRQIDQDWYRKYSDPGLGQTSAMDFYGRSKGAPSRINFDRIRSMLDSNRTVLASDLKIPKNSLRINTKPYQESFPAIFLRVQGNHVYLLPFEKPGKEKGTPVYRENKKHLQILVRQDGSGTGSHKQFKGAGLPKDIAMGEVILVHLRPIAIGIEQDTAKEYQREWKSNEVVLEANVDHSLISGAFESISSDHDGGKGFTSNITSGAQALALTALARKIDTLLANAISNSGDAVEAIQSENTNALRYYSGDQRSGKGVHSSKKTEPILKENEKTEASLKNNKKTETFLQIRLALEYMQGLEKISVTAGDGASAKSSTLPATQRTAITLAEKLVNTQMAGVTVTDWCRQSTWDNDDHLRQCRDLLQSASADIDHMLNAFHKHLGIDGNTVPKSSAKSQQDATDPAHSSSLADSQRQRIFNAIENAVSPNQLKHVLNETKKSPVEGRQALERTLDEQPSLDHRTYQQFANCWQQIFTIILPELRKPFENPNYSPNEEAINRVINGINRQEKQLFLESLQLDDNQQRSLLHVFLKKGQD
ncbi:MAG: hypothetical protein V4568_10580 [Pseudomonadota bacterium]